jgi:hypothetical protein
MFDVTIEKGVEIVIVQQVVDALTDGYEYGIKFLK